MMTMAAWISWYRYRNDTHCKEPKTSEAICVQFTLFAYCSVQANNSGFEIIIDIIFMLNKIGVHGW